MTTGTTLVGVTVTGTVQHTKGVWAQIVASTTYDTTEIIVCVQASNSGRLYAVDIGIGAAASEVVLIPNLYYGSNTAPMTMYRLPVNIPAGTRVAARCQSGTSGSSSVFVSCILLAGTMMAGSPMGRVQDYGVTTASTAAVSVDSGGVAHTKSAWAELVASTDGTIRYLLLNISYLSNITASAKFLIDVGVGAGGSEVVIAANIPITNQSNMDAPTPQNIGIAVNIPAGSRLAVRHQSDSIDVTSRLLNYTAYGVS